MASSKAESLVRFIKTRIPQEMAELLDDLFYRLKKEGKPHTKQTIAIEALESYLAKSGLIDAPERRTLAN